jgi:hypothetical protein
MADAGHCRITGQSPGASDAAPVLCSVSCHAHDNVMTLQCNEAPMCHICGSPIYRPQHKALSKPRHGARLPVRGLASGRFPLGHFEEVSR